MGITKSVSDECGVTIAGCFVGLFVCLSILAGESCAVQPAKSPPTSDRLEELIEAVASPERAVWLDAANELGAMAQKSNELRKVIWDRVKVNTLGQRFVEVDAGTFSMGPDWHNHAVYQDAHKVTVSRPFLMSVTEVSNLQFHAFRPSAPASEYSSDSDSPAVRISWDDAVAFCEFLSENENAKYRLPTEAEWEYACRAGSTHTWSHGRFRWGLSQYAWCDDSELRASRVALLKPNAWGLYDMQGNVMEWVSDWHSNEYYANCKSKGTVVDPQGPVKVGLFGSHVLRGGAWIYDNAEVCSCTARLPLPTFDRAPFQSQEAGFRDAVGFRIVREMD